LDKALKELADVDESEMRKNSTSLQNDIDAKSTSNDTEAESTKVNNTQDESSGLQRKRLRLYTRLEANVEKCQSEHNKSMQAVRVS
jgi:hypothetical protein